MGRPPRPEPEKLDIQFMPIPKTWNKHHNGWKWEVLLRPVKAAPGSPARIRVHGGKTPKNAEYIAKAEIQRIKKRLEKVAPLENWEFQCRQIESTEGLVGVFAVYHGMLTQAEKQDQMLRRAEYSKRAKKAAEVRRARKALAPKPADNVTLLHPSPRGRYQ
jgi:hypothetical protein